MGRPKGSKNKSTLAKLGLEEAKNIVQTQEKTFPASNEEKETSSGIETENTIRSKKAKTYDTCERCGAEIYCSPNIIDTNYLTGKAEYWRQIPRRVKICGACSEELSNLIEKFMLEKGVMKSIFEN